MKVRNTTKDHPFLKLLVANGGIEIQESQGQRELVSSSQLPKSLGGYGKKDILKVYEDMGVKVKGETEGDDIFLDVILPEGWRKESTEHSMWSELLDSKGRSRASIFYKAAFYDRSSHISLNNRFSISEVYYLPEDQKGKMVRKMVEIENPQISQFRNRRKELPIIEIDGEVYFEEGYDFQWNLKKTIEEEREVWVPRFKSYYAEVAATPHYVEVKDGKEIIFTTKSTPLFFTKKYRKDGHRKWHDDYDLFKTQIREQAVQFLQLNYPDWQNTNAYWD